MLSVLSRAVSSRLHALWLVFWRLRSVRLFLATYRLVSSWFGLLVGVVMFVIVDDMRVCVAVVAAVAVVHVVVGGVAVVLLLANKSPPKVSSRAQPQVRRKTQKDSTTR